MKLSEKLERDHKSGDFGNALEGYSEQAKKVEDAAEMLADRLSDLAKDSLAWKAWARKAIAEYKRMMKT